MSEHTPGRLYLLQKYKTVAHAEQGTRGRRVFDADSMGDQTENEANARRLVACWNACDGITDPENVVPRLLALNKLVPNLEHQAATLRVQRDELLAVLHMALPALEAMRKQWPRIPLDDSMDVVEVVRAAIAKVKGGAA